MKLINMSQKRTCKGCRVLNTNSGKCQLGFDVDGEHHTHTLTSVKPLEECPKPTTIDDFLFCWGEDLFRK